VKNYRVVKWRLIGHFLIMSVVFSAAEAETPAMKLQAANEN